MAPFNYRKAKEAGYSDDEISSFLSERDPDFNLNKAKEAGYSQSEINEFLSTRKSPEKQSPATLSGSASAYGSGLAGGAGGLAADVLEIIQPLSFMFPALQQAEKLGKVSGLQNTHELTQSIANDMGMGSPGNSLERILQQSGQFGGQEALIGTAVGGPVGGGAGLLHGNASGALYGGLKELGMDEEWALGITLLATLSPIAAQKLMSKFKAGKDFREAVKSVEKEVPAKSPVSEIQPEPPGSPPLAFPFIGEEVSTGRSGYELAEEALGELQKNEGIKPQSLQMELPSNISNQVPSLRGRAEVKKEVNSPSTSSINLPKEEGKPLTGRAKVISSEVESVISPDKFYNDKQGGINLSGNVKNELEKENKIVRNKYKLAEKVYQSESDIVPSLSAKVESALDSLYKTAEPSAAEKMVIKQLESLQKIIGKAIEPIEVGLDRLIKTSDSMAQLLNYEVPGGGPKNMLKSFVKEINDTVIESLERKGVSAKAIKDADKAYSEMAHKFFNDEISSFIEKTIRNPEAIYRKAVTDEGIYRALKDALGKSHRKSIEKLERSIVESAIDPFVKDLQKVGTKQYETTMRNLEGLIGGEKANKIRSRLDQWKNLRSKTVSHTKPRKLDKERITSSTKSVPVKRNPVSEKIPREVTTTRKLEKEKVTYPTQASKYVDKTPSEIEKMMESREGIKELRSELSKKGLSKLFDKIAQEKTIEILRGETVASKKLVGDEVYGELIKKKNYDILSEIYGKNAVDTTISETAKAAHEKLKITMFKELAKLGATAAGASKLYKVVSILLKGS